MAFDKLVDSAALEANLKTVADAIREKAGTSGALAFPAGFAEAIAAIEAGGGSGGGMETGTFLLAEFTALRNNAYVVNHSLNAVPRYIFLWREDVFGATDARTKNEIYCIIASSEKVLCVYQGSSTSYNTHASYLEESDWTTSPSGSDKPKVSISNVNENSFAIGANALSVGLNVCNYRWMVVA